jgi:hypothetical protein
MGKRHPESQDSRRIFSLADLGIILTMLLSIALLKPLRISDLQTSFQPSPKPSPETATSTASFRQAVNQAMRAAVLTQTARTRADWLGIVDTWQAAIAAMKAVPTSSRHYELAQQKAIEYQRNIAYAQQKAVTSADSAKVGTQADDRPLKIASTQFPLNLHLAANRNKTGILGHPARDRDPFLATQANLESRNWLMIAKAHHQTYYIDTESLNRNQPYVEFWQRIYESQANNPPQLQDQQILANCQTFQFQLKKMIHYQEGKTYRTTPKILATAPKDSAQMRLISSVCAE